MKKQIFTLLAIPWLFTQLDAQRTFQKFIKVNGVLNAGNIRRTGDSGFIVTGNYRLRDRASPRYILLAKLDSRAQPEWVRVFGDSISSYDGQIVTACNDGGYAVTGQAYEGGSFYMYVVKYDYRGDIAWSRKITYPIKGTSSIFARDITETTNGSLLITGETNGSSLGDEFVLSMKSTSGNVNWVKTIGTANYRETGYSIHVMADDGFVVGGTSIPDEGDFFIVKYDHRGDPQWTRTIKSGFLSNSVLYAIIPTLDSGYAFTGITSADNNNYNVVAVKLDRRHDVEWSKIIGRTTYDAGRAIIQDKKDSSYFIAGAEDLVGFDLTKGYLLHFNKRGKLLSSRLTPGAGEYTYYTSLIKDRNGLLAAGTSRNRILLTRFDETGSSCNDFDANDSSSQRFPVNVVSATYSSGNITADMVIKDLPLEELAIESQVKLICSSGKGTIAVASPVNRVVDADPFSLKIFPNPVMDNRLRLTITESTGASGIISILNEEGKMMLWRNVFFPQGTSTSVIDVSSLANGLYFLKITNGREQRVWKFVKGEAP